MKRFTPEMLQDMKPGTELVVMRRRDFNIVTYRYLGKLNNDPLGYFYMVSMTGKPERFHINSLIDSRDVWAIYDENEFNDYQKVIISFHEDEIKSIKDYISKHGRG